jgi:ligand-binding sensor domain-containing protein
MSTNDGAKWSNVALPAGLTQISAVAVDSLKNLWVGGLEGVFYSSDSGATWKQIQNLEIHEVDGIFYDTVGDRVLLTTADATVIFSVKLPEYKVTYWDTGWKLRFARPVGDHLLGITLYDGIVIQPKMVDSAGSDAHAGTGK